MHNKLGKRKQRELAALLAPHIAAILPPAPPPPSNPPSTTPRKILLVFITGGGTAIYVTLTSWAYSASVGGDMMTASVTLFLAWTAGVIALGVSEISGAFTPSKRMAINAGFAIFLAVLTIVLGFYFNSKRPTSTSHTPTPIIAAAQFEQLSNLSQLLLNNNTNESINFDYYDMLHTNIAVQIERIGWLKAGNTGIFPYQQFAQGTGYEMKAVTGNWNGTRIHIGVSEHSIGLTEKPNEVFHLITTVRYQRAMQQLQGVIDSPLIPETIKVPVRALQKAALDNTDLMFAVLNEKKHQDDNYFLQYNAPSNKYSDAIQDEYFQKFKSLEPRARAVLEAIQESFHTN